MSKYENLLIGFLEATKDEDILWCDRKLLKLVENVKNECISREIIISPAYLEFMVKILALRTEWLDKLEDCYRDDDDRGLVRLITNQIELTNKPLTAILKLQAYCHTHAYKRAEIIERNRAKIKLLTAPLVKEVAEAAELAYRDDMVRLYERMVVAMVLKSGLGKPTNSNVMKEATAALQSVFPLSEMGEMLAKEPHQREEQLEELTQIVAGIRVFNRDRRKGGDSIDDLPKMMHRALAATMETVHAELENLEQTELPLFTAAALNVCFVPDPYKENKVQTEMIKNHLTVRRQFQLYYKALRDSVQESSNNFQPLYARLQDRLMHIQQIIKFRTTIPNSQVFPQFMELADIWASLQDEMVILSAINETINQINMCKRSFPRADIALFKSLAGDQPLITDAARNEMASGVPAGSLNLRCRLIEPGIDTKDVFIEYNGFCPWTVVKGQGVLVPGNVNLGLCKWRETHYALASVAAIKEFGADPDKYLDGVEDMARMRSDLVYLLGIEDYIITKLFPKTLMPTDPIYCNKKDVCVQTDVHPIRGDKDPLYEWNEWSMRLNAVDMEKLRAKKTRSTQTQVTWDVATQATVPFVFFAKGVQTGVDKASSMDPPLFKRRGLIRMVPDSKLI